MKKVINTKFKVSNKTSFLKTINPSHPTLEKKIGKACADAADQLLEKIQDKRLNAKYKSYFSTSHDNIYRHIELPKEEKIEFTVKVLNTFLCFFFFKKPSKYRFNEIHSEKNLRDFFNHIKISNGKYADVEIFNKFLDDLKLVNEYLTPLFNDFSFEINHDWEISMVKKLELENKKTTFKIDGATLINNSFFQKIQNNDYTLTDFYTSKYDNKCQWFGIIKGFDVPRKETYDFVNIVKSSFETPRTLKISSIIYGGNGVGKSTFLRRIIFELRNEKFRVIWLREMEELKFFNQGLDKIEADSRNDYLVVIEHLNVNIETIHFFLKRIKSFSNIRVIISIKNIKGSIYYEHLINRNHQLLIDNSDNEDIISQILRKIPKWQRSGNELLKQTRINNITLYSLLYIIAQLENESITGKIDLSEPNRTFEKIIALDFKKIFKEYPGIAKTLFYLSCIYVEHRTIPLYSHFLLMADFFNRNSEVSKHFYDLNNGQSHIHEILRNYVHTYNDPISDSSYLFFNHDTLVYSGISKMSYFLPELGEFDSITKRELLDGAFEDVEKNTLYSFLILEFMIKKSIHIFKNESEVYSYIDKILESKEKKYYFHNFFEIKELSDYLIRKCLDKLLFSNMRFSRYDWVNIFTENSRTISMVLNHWNISELPKDAIIYALKISKSKQDIGRAILKLEKTPNLNSSIYSLCNKLKNN